MSTLIQIRNAVRVMIDQPEDNSRFTNSELNVLINEAKDFVSDSIAHPRTLKSIITQKSKGKHNLPSDNLIVKQAFFGDTANNGDVKELEIISLKALSTRHPGWIEDVPQNDGRPALAAMLDSSSIFIYPRPDQNEAGKSLIINYEYRATDLSSDSDVPDIALPYHHMIVIYTAHLCYLGKLSNTDEAIKRWNMFKEKMKILEDPVEAETDSSSGFEFIDSPDVA
jgi:hypothetical protein